MANLFWLVFTVAAVPAWLIWAYIVAVAIVLGAFGWLAASRPREQVSSRHGPACACGSPQGGGRRG